MITKKNISDLAAEAGFSAACFCLPQKADEAPEGVECLVLLLKSYLPHDGTVDAFYPAKNASYHAVQTLMRRLENLQVKTCLLSNERLKPIATDLAGLTRGMNTINYHAVFGSKFCMEMIGLDCVPEGEDVWMEGARLQCADCGRCMRACPGGAITQEGFVKENCIRFYMMSGKAMPEHLRPFVGAKNGSYAVIGCDICQRVCPGNAHMEALRGMDTDGFTIDELLACSDETLEKFAALYGRNYAVRNRVIAQALLAAGNSADLQYLPAIQALKASPSPVVREHAAWSEKRMKELQKFY